MDQFNLVIILLFVFGYQGLQECGQKYIAQLEMQYRPILLA